MFVRDISFLRMSQVEMHLEINFGIWYKGLELGACICLSRLGGMCAKRILQWRTVRDESSKSCTIC